MDEILSILAELKQDLREHRLENRTEHQEIANRLESQAVAAEQTRTRLNRAEKDLKNYGGRINNLVLSGARRHGGWKAWIKIFGILAALAITALLSVHFGR